MWVHEFCIPHSGLASGGASLYPYANLPFYSWLSKIGIIGMPSLKDFRMYEWSAVSIVVVRAPWAYALKMRRI